MTQKQAAAEAMAGWLVHPSELGKKPFQMVCTNAFVYNGMQYFIFKFKKHHFGAWLLGVCGGYEDDSLEHCGHVFSNYKPYSPASEREEAVEIIEMIQQYWKDRAKELGGNI